MKIGYAMKLWNHYYGNSKSARDFHGNTMFKNAYGQNKFGGWNVHHILPKACGGSTAMENLICTNIATNSMAANMTTYWIDDCLYQVKKVYGSHRYKIEQII